MHDALQSFRSAAALDLMTLAQLHNRELDMPTIAALQQEQFPGSLALRLKSATGLEAADILTRVVAALEFDGQQQDEHAADFAAIYLTHHLGASPCESVWLDEEGLAMQSPMFSVRDYYARFGWQAHDWRKRTDDHLVLQLQFIAELLAGDDEGVLVDVTRFLDEHTLRWLPQFAERVAQRCATPFYAGLCMLTASYLDELRDILAWILDKPRPSAEEIAQASIKQVEQTPLPMPGPYVPGSSPSW
jgi:TorA maturation chaperone TorD